MSDVPDVPLETIRADFDRLAQTVICPSVKHFAMRKRGSIDTCQWESIIAYIETKSLQKNIKRH